MSNTNIKIKRQRVYLFLHQEGKCHWCRCDMVLMFAAPPNFRPKNLATLDHLRDRWDETRSEPNPERERRRVLACHECNMAPGNASQAAQPIEVLHERAGGHSAQRALLDMRRSA